MTRTVAALYVQKGGAYYDLEGVDPWDEQRDARLYAGPHPVVAHPPCSRWCRLAGLVEARWGHKRGARAVCRRAPQQRREVHVEGVEPRRLLRDVPILHLLDVAGPPAAEPRTHPPLRGGAGRS